MSHALFATMNDMGVAAFLAAGHAVIDHEAVFGVRFGERRDPIHFREPGSHHGEQLYRSQNQTEYTHVPEEYNVIDEMFDDIVLKTTRHEDVA